MGNSSDNIEVLYNNEIVETINPNNPSLDKLKDFVLDHRKDLNVDLIKCSCDKENFDNETFIKVLKESIKEELENLKLNEESFQNSMKEIEINEE